MTVTTEPQSLAAESLMTVTAEPELLAYLEQHAIPYQLVEHPPVYTCDQADQLCPAMPGAGTKNLLLSDRHDACYLVMAACETRLDLKALGRQLGLSRLHFASPEQLLERLGVTPGAVSALCLVNDPTGQVGLLVDAAVWGAEAFQCHPLVNTATLVIGKDGLQRFFELTGHPVQVVALPPAAA